MKTSDGATAAAADAVGGGAAGRDPVPSDGAENSTNWASQSAART